MLHGGFIKPFKMYGEEALYDSINPVYSPKSIWGTTVGPQWNKKTNCRYFTIMHDKYNYTVILLQWEFPHFGQQHSLIWHSGHHVFSPMKGPHIMGGAALEVRTIMAQKDPVELKNVIPVQWWQIIKSKDLAHQMAWLMTWYSSSGQYGKP